MVLDQGEMEQYPLGMNRLLKYRLALKPPMSQRQFAVLLGTQQPQVSRWERWGDQSVPDARQIPWYWARRAAAILKVRPIDLRPDFQHMRSLDLMIEGAPESVQDRIWAIVRTELERD